MFPKSVAANAKSVDVFVHFLKNWRGTLRKLIGLGFGAEPQAQIHWVSPGYPSQFREICQKVQKCPKLDATPFGNMTPFWKLPDAPKILKKFQNDLWKKKKKKDEDTRQQMVRCTKQWSPRYSRILPDTPGYSRIARILPLDTQLWVPIVSGKCLLEFHISVVFSADTPFHMLSS